MSLYLQRKQFRFRATYKAMYFRFFNLNFVTHFSCFFIFFGANFLVKESPIPNPYETLLERIYYNFGD